MRVLVCGGRDYRDASKLAEVLSDLHRKHSFSCVIAGAASGADKMAEKWANASGIETDIYPANWWGEGRSAGPRRNAKMLAEGKPDLVVAFPGGRGTADMTSRAKSAGVRVIEVTP